MSGDNKLNLVVRFTALDGLSGALKGMIGLGRSSTSEMHRLGRELRDVSKKVKEYDDKIKQTTGSVNHLWDAQKKLLAQEEQLRTAYEREKRYAAIDGRTARIQSRAERYRAQGQSGLLWGMAAAVPAYAMAHEAADYQAMVNKLHILGLGDKAVNNLTAYSQAMGIAGSSAKENLRYLLEAQGAFRESGEHSLADQLRGAKTMAPLMAKMAATLKASGKEMDEEQEGYFLRFIEQAGGTTDPRRAKALTDGLFRALQSSGGTVDPAAYQGFLARAGTSGMRLSARAMFADFEPLIAEMHDSAGVGLMTAYSRVNGMVKNQSSMRELIRLGLWDQNKIEFNAAGGVKRFKNGENPLNAPAAAMMASDPVEFYRRYVLPSYRAKGVKDVQRENMTLFGNKGGALFNLIDKQLPTILRSREAYQRTQGLDQAYNQTKDSFFGQQGQMRAAWKDFLVTAGTKGGLLESLTGGLRMATGALRALTGAANAHPTAFKWIGTAVMWLIGMRIATAGVKLVFGNLLGPVAQLWGVFSKYRAAGSFVAAFPRIARVFGVVRSAALLLWRGFGLIGRAGNLVTLFPRIAGAIELLSGPVGWAIAGVTALAGAAYLVYRNWGAVSGFFKAHWTRIRNLFLTGLVIFAPFVAAMVWVAAKVYNNWDKISATFGKAWTGIKFKFRQGIDSIKGMWSEFTTWLSHTAVGKAMKWGGDIADGLGNGIKTYGRKALNAVGKFSDNVGGNFAKQLQIRSPSRVFMAFGGHIADGLAIGLGKGEHRPVQAMKRMAAVVAGASALSLAPAASARTPSHASGPAKIEIHIHQQPGEDVQALIRRVMAELRRAQRSGALTGYADDF